uniref:Uncharacterized protein n=1 Tax=Anopheles darlingi TaxID=43151 RepID=A0A2M4CW31_ANODA
MAAILIVFSPFPIFPFLHLSLTSLITHLPVSSLSILSMLYVIPSVPGAVFFFSLLGCFSNFQGSGVHQCFRLVWSWLAPPFFYWRN